MKIRLLDLFIYTFMYEYRFGCTHSCVQFRMYRLYVQTGVYRFVCTDLFVPTRVHRLIGTDRGRGAATQWELEAASWALGARGWELGAGRWELGAGS